MDYVSLYEEQKEKDNINVTALLENFILDTMKNTAGLMIQKFHGDYEIVICYGNGYNIANGEDL